MHERNFFHKGCGGSGMMNIGILGNGYVDLNAVRSFNSIKDVKVISLCGVNPQSLAVVGSSFPGIATTTAHSDIIKSTSIDAVVVTTHLSTHYELVKSSLLNGKHVFVEKPFTQSVAQGEELIELAENKGLKIMVDHPVLFTGAVKKIKELIESDILGEILYYDSTRVNLGLFRNDVNVIWELTPDDLCIMDYIIQEKPEAITANGRAHSNHSFTDVAYLTVYYSSNTIAHLNANWLSPVKVQTTLIGGRKRMLVWNDLDANEKIKVYDKGVRVQTDEGNHKLLLSNRCGDMWSPKVEQAEALRTQAEYFVDCVMNNVTPFNDGAAGLRIVKLLVASNESLTNSSKLIMLN